MLILLQQRSPLCGKRLLPVAQGPVFILELEDCGDQFIDALLELAQFELHRGAWGI